MEISKSKRLYVLWGVLLFLAVLLYFNLNPSGQFFYPKCPIYQHFGIYCSGCGSQRALHDILHLRVWDALKHNLLLLPGLLFIGVELSYRFFWPHKKSPFYQKWTPWIVLTIILLFTILRNIRTPFFEFLAP